MSPHTQQESIYLCWEGYSKPSATRTGSTRPKLASYEQMQGKRRLLWLRITRFSEGAPCGRLWRSETPQPAAFSKVPR
jgi:hypothetical protein